GILTYWATRINFEEDISKLIPSGENSEQINRVLQRTNFADKIIVNISSTNPENMSALQSFADELSDSLSLQSQYIKEINSKFEDDQLFELFDFVSAHLPFYLNEEDYDKIDSLLQPEIVSEKVEEAYHSIVSPSGMVTAQMVRSDPFGLTFLGLSKFKQVQAGDNFNLQDGYLIHQNGKNLLVFI